MHVSLYVSNLENTIAFYSRFFNKAPEKIENGYTKYILEKPSLIISFLENPERVQSNFGHLGIQVETEAELQRYRQIADDKNLISKEEIGTACCYAIQDKFWAEDPDGIQWEVYYFHEDAQFNDPHYASEEASACCTPAQKEEKPKVKLSEIQNATCEPGSGCC